MASPPQSKPPQNSPARLAGQKRPLNPEETSEPTPDDLARMSRSERKRHREMKRRNHISKGFDELTSLLVRIDQDFKEEIVQRENERQSKSTGKSADGDSALPISRVELINHAVTIVERIHHENEQRKQLITELTGRLRNVTASVSGGEDQVTIMVPTLQPLDSMMSFSHRTGRIGMAPSRYATNLPPSLAHVGLTHHAASFPPPPAGGMLGMGVEGLGYRGFTPAELFLSRQRGSAFPPSYPLGLSGRGQQMLQLRSDHDGQQGLQLPLREEGQEIRSGALPPADAVAAAASAVINRSLSQDEKD